MNNETNNLNKENNEPIQPINSNENNIVDSINNTPVPLQPITSQEEPNNIGLNTEANLKTQEQPTNVVQEEVKTNVEPVNPVNIESNPTPIANDEHVNNIINANTLPQEPVVSPTSAVASTPITEPTNVVSPIPPVVNTPMQEPANIVSPTVNQQNIMQPNESMVNTEQEPIQSITTGPVNNNNINGVVDQTNIGFVSTGQPLKKKKNPLVVSGIVLVILLVVGSLGYFVGYPLIMKSFFNKPKEAFTKGINSVTNYATTIADDTIHDKGIVDIKLSLDTNIDAIKQFSGYTYGAKIGVDPSSNSLEFGYNIYDQSTKDDFSEYYYYKKDSFYKRYSTYRDLIYLSNVDNNMMQTIFTFINDNQEQINKLNNNDAKYIINKVASSLISSIDEDKLVKEDTSYTINGKSIKATRNKYVMNKTILVQTRDKIIDDLTSDDKALEILSNILEIDKAEVNSNLKELITFNDNDNLTIGIITNGNKLNIVGYEINYSDKVNINYYKDNGNFEIKLYLKTNVDNETEETNIDILGIKKDKITDVSIKVDDKEVAKLAVSSWSNEEIIFDYSIIDQDEKTITGSLNYVKKNSGKDLNVLIDLKIKNDDTYLNATLELNNDWSNEVANINTTAAKTLTDEELQEIDTTFFQYITNTPIGVLFKTIGGDVDPDINDYYDTDIEESDQQINEGNIDESIEQLPEENINMDVDFPEY